MAKKALVCRGSFCAVFISLGIATLPLILKKKKTDRRFSLHNMLRNLISLLEISPIVFLLFSV